MTQIWSVLLLLLLPVSCETMRAMKQRWQPTVLAIAAALMIWMALPAWLSPVALGWCGACVLHVWFYTADARRRGWVWLLTGTVGTAALLWLLGRHYEGDLLGGIARSVAARVGQSGSADSLLTQAIRTGLVNPGILGQAPVISWAGRLLLSDTAREQMLYSLETSIRLLLTAGLPLWIVAYLGLNSLACAAMPDGAAAMRTGMRELPPPAEWHMKRPTALFCAVVVLTATMVLPSASDTMYWMASLVQAAGMTAFAVQGAVMLRGIAKRKEWMGGLAWGLAAFLALMAPNLLVFGGVIDQVLDPRRLRKPDEDDKEDGRS